MRYALCVIRYASGWVNIPTRSGHLARQAGAQKCMHTAPVKKKKSPVCSCPGSRPPRRSGTTRTRHYNRGKSSGPFGHWKAPVFSFLFFVSCCPGASIRRAVLTATMPPKQQLGVFLRTDGELWRHCRICLLPQFMKAPVFELKSRTSNGGFCK